MEVSKKFVSNILERWPDDEQQIDVLAEECSELIKALLKYKQATKGLTKISLEEAKGAIAEEMAHVMISFAVVSKALDISESDLTGEVDKKARQFYSSWIVGRKD